MRALLDGLAEPAAIVAVDGSLLATNPPLRKLLGTASEAGRLAEFHRGSPAALDTYLRRCLGSSAPLTGALHLPTGPGRYRLRGSRIELSQGAAILLLIDNADFHRFATFNRQIAQLQTEIAERRHAEAVLEETVRERELLLREVHHRVKNNMQMLHSLLLGAEREATSCEAKAALRDVSSRISAVAAVQQLLYRSEVVDTVDACEMVEAVVVAARAVVSHDVAIDTQCDRFPLDINAATSLALVVNELVTNALKYGRPADGDRQTVRVIMIAADGKAELKVEDNGPGFELHQHRKRASGLGLVSGLLRQLGGTLDLDGSDGGKCFVTIPVTVRGGGRNDRRH